MNTEHGNGVWFKVYGFWFVVQGSRFRVGLHALGFVLIGLGFRLSALELQGVSTATFAVLGTTWRFEGLG